MNQNNKKPDFAAERVTMSEITPEKSTTGFLTENLRKILHEKESVCNELEKLKSASGIDYSKEIARLSDAFAAAGELPPEFAELLEKRFADAVKNAHLGESEFLARQQQIAKLRSGVDSLLAADEFATLPEVEKLEKQLLQFDSEKELLDRLMPLKSRLLAEEAAVKAAEDAANALADELDGFTAMEDIAPLNENKSRIEAAFAELANIPRKAALRYNDAHRRASIKLAQHYETLDLARWESYTHKLDICAELEKLLNVEESALADASVKLCTLREQWKKLGSVPKEKSDEINPRYLELTRQLQHKVDEYFARKRQQQKLAAAEKEKLIASALELADSTDWKVTAEKMRQLQTQWKALPRAGARESGLFQQFHDAADRFFTARKSAFDARDKKFRQIEEQKLAIIAEAEQLTDHRRARQLREDFRNAGFCGRKEQELYKRFNEAMDKFFSAKREEHASKTVRAQELIGEITALTDNPAESLTRIREIREELRTLNCRETRSAGENALRKFDRALDEFRNAEQRKKEESSDEIAMSLALCLSAWQNGENPELPDVENFAGFSKLQNGCNLLRAAMDGDAKAAEKLEKHIAAARKERQSICDELDILAGNGKKDDAPVDLASELEAAMLGNFGKSPDVNSSVKRDPRQLCAAFAAAGVIPAGELAELQQRFNAAKKIVFN